MSEIVRMIGFLTVISLASGGLLAALREGTQERIDQQVLEYVKGPSIRTVLAGAANDPVNTRFQLSDGEKARTFFVGVLDGDGKAVALEGSSPKGYKGDVGLMVAIEPKTGKLIGIDVTTHNETPGLGAKAKTDPKFAAQFKGIPAAGPIKVTQD